MKIDIPPYTCTVYLAAFEMLHCPPIHSCLTLLISCHTMALQTFEVLKVISWNVRGLNSKFKRVVLFQYLKSQSPHIILLQETHLIGSKIMALKKPWIQRAFSDYARGVSVLISKKLPGVIEHIHTDPFAKYVIVVMTLWQIKYVITALYVRPPFSPDILFTVLERILPHCLAKLLIMGDFNSTMSPTLDPPQLRNFPGTCLTGHWLPA